MAEYEIKVTVVQSAERGQGGTGRAGGERTEPSAGGSAEEQLGAGRYGAEGRTGYRNGAFSKSTVSRPCAALDARVRAFNEHPLGRFPFLLIDALYVKAREDERVVSKAGLLVSGINAEGYREVLGLKMGDSESEGFWRERVIRIFSNEESAYRLIGALVAEIHEEWQG